MQRLLPPVLENADSPASDEKAMVFPLSLQNSASSVAQSDSKHDSKHTPHEKLLAINAGEEEKDYSALSDSPASWPAELPAKLTEFLRQTNLIPEQLQQANISFEMLTELLNRGYSGHILRWLALDDTLMKAVMYPWLDERAIQAEEIPEDKNNKGCASLSTWVHTRVWLKGAAIPFRSEVMLKRAYGISGFFEGIETIVTRVWSLLLASLLANDLYYYYTYSDERYGTTVSQLFFTQSNNEQLSLTASLTRPTVWPELFVAPIVWGIIKALRMRYASTALDQKSIQAMHHHLQQYQSGFVQDTIAWLLPINGTRAIFEQLQQALLWDNRLSAKKRHVLYSSLQPLSRRANKVTQWYALEAISSMADGVDLADVERLRKAGVAQDILLSLLHMKTQALAELQYQARHYKYPTSRETSWYAHYLKPLPRYLLAHYLLWCLGQPESKGLQPLFWSFKVAKGYIKVKLLYTLYLGIKQLIDFYLAKRDCEAQGKLWLYMNQVADYVCSVCGDLPVFYGNIFNMTNCLNDFLSRPQPLSQIVTLLNRIQFSDNITTLDFSYQQFSDTKNELAIILPVIQARLPELQSLDLNNAVFGEGAIGVTSAQHIATFLIYSSLRFLSCSSQNISDRGAEILAQALPQSKLQYLELNTNQIVNISVLVQVLPHSNLQHLYLRDNQIADINVLAQALPGSILQTLDLSNNQILNISILTQAMRNSSLQVLYLSGNLVIDVSGLSQVLPQSKLRQLELSLNQIIDISTLAQALPGSVLQTLGLSNNFITDISTLVKALPYSMLQTLDLSGNQIVNISTLAQGLRQTILKNLYLENNQIVDIRALAQVLPHSGLQTLSLSSNQITNITLFAQALPYSVLQALDLSSNQFNNICGLTDILPLSILQMLYLDDNQIADISSLAQAVSNSSLQVLSLSNNQIIDISAFAQTLPSSMLKSLYLNNNQIANISTFAQALPYSRLKTLDLTSNSIIDICKLVQVLPQSMLEILVLGSNSIADISTLVQTLPHSRLQSLALDGNPLADSGAESIANVLTKANLNPSHPLWINSLDPNEKRVIAQAQPNTHLTYLDLSNSQINTTGAKALCRVLPQTKIGIKNLYLYDNPGIDSNVVDINTCIISAASSLQPPLPLRFFYGLTQLTFYPVKQTYFSLCNLLANKPTPASSTIKTLQTDEKINHALLWQMSNHTEETGQVSPLALADDANISVPRFNSSKTNDTLVLFFFTLLAGYALYRLVQTTTQSFSSFISTADEKSVSPLASNKPAKPASLNFISAWWQSRPVETNLTGEHFGEAMKHLMRALLRVDRVLRRLDQHESQLSKEMQTDVDRIRFYWLEHMEMVEDFRSAGKARKKEIVELRTAIRELQTEANALLGTLPINDSRFFKSHVPIELAAYPANKPAVTQTADEAKHQTHGAKASAATVTAVQLPAMKK